MADVIILNEKHIHSKATDSFRDLNAIANKYIDLIESKSCFEPSEMETLMTMAYANSMRSSCTQRKVGALIIDNYGNVFSSGYNEVPSSERPCINQYGMCYRKYLRANIDKKLNDILHDTELTIEVSKTIKNNSKMLDYCRALHAEESAIININEIKTRQCVYISRDVHSKILKIVNDIAGREISVGGYVDTVLRQHLEQHKEKINELYKKQREDLI